MKLNAIRYSAFILLWLCYCLLYFTRKPLGLIKSDLSERYGYSKLTIGILDTALLLPYALFQIIFGNLGDSINPTRFLSACVIGAGISTMFLGPVDKLWFIVLSLFFSGTFQAFCWPLMVKIVSLLFTASKNQHFVLGIFGTSAFAGGTLGTLLAVFIKDQLTWRWVYPIPSVIVSLTGLALLLFYKCAFKKVINERHIKPMVPRKDIENGSATGDEKPVLTMSKKASKLAFLSHAKGSIVLLWKIPLVFNLAISNFCLKMIRYILYMWLPYMLEHKNNFSSTKAGNISAVFEVGGVMGSILLGLIIDKCFSKTQFKGLIVMVLCQIGAMSWFIFTTSPHLHWLINTAALLFVGTFIGGIDSLISSSIPLLVTACFKVDASSGVVGLVNGIGTLGTFIEGPLVGLVLHVTSPPVDHAANSTQPAGSHKAITNFAGLFWIIGVLSIIPAVVLTIGYLCNRTVLNAYCEERLLSSTTRKDKGDHKEAAILVSPLTTTSPADSSSLERALLHKVAEPDFGTELTRVVEGSDVRNGGEGTHLSPNGTPRGGRLNEQLSNQNLDEMANGGNVRLTGYRERPQDPVV